MPYFSKKSSERLSTCNPLLQEIANEAIKYVDFSVVYGHRTKLEQDKLFETNFSRVKWPTGKHNSWPSKAVDIIPYPGGWKGPDKNFFYIAGVFMAVAKSKGISIRWGGAWKGTFNKKDEWNDLAHFELLENL